MKSKKVLMTVLFLLALFLILFLTFQSTEKSGELSQSIANRIIGFLRAHGFWFPKGPGFIYVRVRKLGHTLEYFLLGAAAMLLFRKSPKGFLKAAALCAVISLSDQVIKGFLPGREFDWTDFPFDIAGYISGSAIVQSISGKISKRKQEGDRKT